MTFSDQARDLIGTREVYSQRLLDLGHMTGPAKQREVASLKEFARRANERLGEFSRSIGEGDAINTESLIFGLLNEDQ